jgi:hypothetical protein
MTPMPERPAVVERPAVDPLSVLRALECLVECPDAPEFCTECQEIKASILGGRAR